MSDAEIIEAIRRWSLGLNSNFGVKREVENMSDAE